MAPALLLIAGEASGDLHASHVLRALKARRPELHVGGMAGDLCAAEGMDLLINCRELAVMGLTEVLTSLGRIRRAFDAVLAWVDTHRPATALLVDYGGFNLRLAAALQRRGVKVVFYISPKVWAWGKRRIPTMRRNIDRLLVIFPFEVAFFAEHGIHAEYVGNPSVDELAAPPQRALAREALGVTSSARVVALLPGSRRSEISRILPLMLDTAEQAARTHPGTRFLLPRATTVDAHLLEPALALRARGVDITVVEGQAHQVVAAADAAVVASGTAVLETAIIGTPQVVVYRAALLTALVVRFFLALRWVNPVNILMQRAVVPELLQWSATTPRTLQALLALLDGSALGPMQQGYTDLRLQLGAPGAPGRVADAVLEVLDGRWQRPVPGAGRA